MCIVFVNLQILVKSHQVVNLQLSARKKKKKNNRMLVYVLNYLFINTFLLKRKTLVK